MLLRKLAEGCGVQSERLAYRAGFPKAIARGVYFAESQRFSVHNFAAAADVITDAAMVGYKLSIVTTRSIMAATSALVCGL